MSENKSNYKIGGWFDPGNILEAGFNTPDDPEKGGIWVCDKVRGYCIDEESAGGDFSVANVEYLVGPELKIPMMMATPAEVYPACSLGTSVYGGLAPALPVILYKGTCAIDTPFTTLSGIVLTGDAEAVLNEDTGEYVILVHGDCTISYIE